MLPLLVIWEPGFEGGRNASDKFASEKAEMVHHGYLFYSNEFIGSRLGMNCLLTVVSGMCLHDQVREDQQPQSDSTLWGHPLRHSSQ